MGDLLAPRPVVYWADFLASLAVAAAATCATLAAPIASATAVVWGAVAAVAILRVAAFRHEITRLRRGEMTAFTYGWNLLAGIPLLHPAFRQPHGATLREHEAGRGDSLADRVATAYAIPGVPVAAALLLLAGSLRLAGIDVGRQLPIVLLAIAATVALLDLARSTVTRRRAAGSGAALAADAVAGMNVDTLLLAALLPVGQRYDALRRLIPSLPYHALGAAHRRILEALPDWHGYRAATWPAPPAGGLPARGGTTDGPGVRRAG